MPEVKLHDGSTIEVEVHGDGAAVLLPVNPRPIEGSQAEEMRKWGADPALGRSLIDGFSDAFQVVAFDYEGHLLAVPKPDTLTPENIAKDLLRIADAVNVDRFAYYGYSWLALSGLQLAIRTDRLSALVMGGFPPIDGPYEEMLRVTEATHQMAISPPQSQPEATDEFDWSTVEVSMTGDQTQQFMTLYQWLRGFDDTAVHSGMTCPRLCFVGSADAIEYGERWGNVTVDIAGPIVKRGGELESLGWDVRVLPDMDHTQAMQAANVLPIVRPWLESVLR